MVSKERSAQIGGAVFLIGLGVIAMLDFWWPGMMFVIGASLLSSAFAQHGSIRLADPRNISAGVVSLIGLFGLMDFDLPWGSMWPLVLIGLGLALLFGVNLRGDKPKNEANF
jgi:hypothetical protein